MEAIILQALKDKQFFVYYQPIVCATSHQIVGYEALTRWHHPRNGIIPPMTFIPVIEQSKQLSAIFCGHLISEVCYAVQTTNKWISFNVSPITLESDVVRIIDLNLAWYNITHSQLCVEITERTKDTKKIKNTVHKLSKNQISIALDDFGTGANELIRLADLEECNRIKIDKALTHELSGDNSTKRLQKIVGHIIHLAHELGIQVVAEGIETERQAVELVLLQCDFLQGFYFGKPELLKG